MTNAYGLPVILPGASCPSGILVRDMVVTTKAERDAIEAAEKAEADKARSRR